MPAPATRLPFLGPADINRDGTTKIKLAGAMRVFSGERGVSLIMEVIIGSANGPHRDWSLMLGKRSFDVLQTLLGRDLSKWPGRTVNVELDPSGKYVNPADATPSAPAPEGSAAPSGTPLRSDDDVPF